MLSSLSATEAGEVRSAFYLPVKNIFLISAIITYFAFIIAFFMHEIPLRKTNELLPSDKMMPGKPEGMQNPS